MGPIPAWIADLQKACRTKLLGREILYLDSTPSTNRRAREEARRGAPEGAVVIADSQSQGRGRMGRPWSSPRGVNLYLSIVLRPPLSPAQIPSMTLLAGVSCARAIGKVTGLDARLKWPNDIYVGGRKTAGILAETEGGNPGLHFVILGIGINVNWEAENMPADLRETATSLCTEGGREFDRSALAGEVLAGLEEDYGLFRNEGFTESMRKEWTRLALGIGEQATLTFPGHKILGGDSQGHSLGQDPW